MTAKSQAFKAKSVENKSNEQHGEKSWGQQGFISIHEKQKFQPAGLVSFITRVDKPKKGSSCVVVDGLGDAPPVY